MTLNEAYKITRQDVADELDGLPPIKMHCSNLAADALKAAIDNYREGARPDVEVITSCDIELRVVLGVDEFLGKGVYLEIPSDLEQVRDKRIVVVDSGDDSLEFALKLTKFTGRVIVVTTAKEIPGRPALAKSLKHSEVKILQQSEVIEIQGELDEVEKVRIHDFDEDEQYSLYIDTIFLLEYRG
jgi:nitrogen fixation NifU-like protein